MPKHTFNQHRAQAHAASREIERVAAELAAEREVPIDVAIQMVFDDKDGLLKRCHDAAPRMRGIDPAWKDPNNEPER